MFTPCWADSLAEKTRQKNLPEIYIVEEGDNLWNISKKYMNDPYSWRTLWGKNKYIDDPNLIFPGEPIYFIKKTKPIVRRPKKTVKIKKTVTFSPPPPPPLPPPKIPVVKQSILDSSGYILPTDHPAGKIISSLDDKFMMGKDDLVYFDIGRKKGAIKGKKYTIYSTIRKVVHPVTGKKFGYLIRILGVIKVLEPQKKMSLGIILTSYKEIEEGDKLMDYENLTVPMIDPEEEIKEKNISGYILTALSNRTGLGLGDIVYIDRGLNQGLSPGDQFIAYRYRGEEKIKDYFSFSDTLPKITIGELKIIAVREKTATALITKSKQELEIGEKIEYKKKIP